LVEHVAARLEAQTKPPNPPISQKVADKLDIPNSWYGETERYRTRGRFINSVC